MMMRLAPLALAAALAACSSGPPVPDWQLNASDSLKRATDAYLDGKPQIEKNEFARARAEIGSTGKMDLLIRSELIRCAARTASLDFEECSGFAALRADAAPEDIAYADYLAGRATSAALLPEPQRAVQAAGRDTAAAAAAAAIADPMSRLVAAGALFKANRATPELAAMAVDTASSQGWRRPLLAWLNVQALRADKAGDTAEAERLRRRIAVVESSAKR